MGAPQKLAAGLKAAQGSVQSFASTQALWRFLANPRVTLPQLVEPLQTLGRKPLSRIERDADGKVKTLRLDEMRLSADEFAALGRMSGTPTLARIPSIHSDLTMCSRAAAPL